MNAQKIIEQLQTVPHDVVDCWGVVERWYRMWLEIDLNERGDIPQGPEGLAKGFDDYHSQWVEVDAPQDNDLVIMHTVIDRQRIAAGHVGVYWNGHVLHSDRGIGCVYQPITNRQIKHRITGYFRHESIA